MGFAKLSLQEDNPEQEVSPGLFGQTPSLPPSQGFEHHKAALLNSVPPPFAQHASSDVERMILGNKSDMNEKRQVSKEKGEKVNLMKTEFLISELPFSWEAGGGRGNSGSLGWQKIRRVLAPPLPTTKCDKKAGAFHKLRWKGATRQQHPTPPNLSSEVVWQIGFLVPQLKNIRASGVKTCIQTHHL